METNRVRQKVRQWAVDTELYVSHRFTSGLLVILIYGKMLCKSLFISYLQFSLRTHNPHLPGSVGGGKSSGHDRIDIANRNEVGKRLVYRDEDSGESTLIGQTRHPLDTEAACKTLVKQRMCLSGSRWRDAGASCVLALRALKLTKDRWQQFWGYVMKHGCTAY